MFRYIGVQGFVEMFGVFISFIGTVVFLVYACGGDIVMILWYQWRRFISANRGHVLLP